MQLKESSSGLSLTPEAFDDLMSRTDVGAAKKIAIAVSGGGDSMALALLLKNWCDQQNKNLIAVTVDHGLRSASKNEAYQVGKWLGDLDVEHHILYWQGSKPKSNIQDEARQARYELLANWCAEQNIYHLFLAHHQNDQAETFLIRLFRGSGVDGLSSMELNSSMPIDGMGSIMLHRPLLTVPKDDLIAYLNYVGQMWFEDPTNDEEKFTRIKIRKLLSASEIDGLNPERLSSTASRMRRVRSLLDELTERAESEYLKYDKLGFAVLEPVFTDELHEEIALRLIAKCLKKVSGQRYSPRLKKLEKLFSNFKNDSFTGQTLNGVLLFKNDSGQIYLTRELNAIDDEVVITKPKHYLWDNRFIIKCEGKYGTISQFTEDRIAEFETKIPNFKKTLAGYFGNATIRDRIVPSLPCIISEEGEIMLWEHLLSILKRNDLDGFSADFKE